jgi:hypothetical protein
MNNNTKFLTVLNNEQHEKSLAAEKNVYLQPTDIIH